MKQFDIIKNKNGEEYAILNPEYKKMISEKHYKLFLEKSGIPPYYWNVEFTDYKGEKSLKSLYKVVLYSREFDKKKFNYVHLYLYGDNSTQKTALMINVGKAAIRKGKSVKFILAGQLLDKLLKTQGFKYNEEIEVELKKIKNHDMLLIDDIFDTTKSLFWQKENASDYIISAWDNFLREIISSNTKVLITSNVPIEMIEIKYGKSMYELINRNFIPLSFFDNIVDQKIIKDFNGLFDNKE